MLMMKKNLSWMRTTVGNNPLGLRLSAVRRSEKSETPDSSLFCRASAQEGDSFTREHASLSTDRIPKTAKHPTARSSVGRQPRTVTQIPESPLVCRLIGYRKPQNTRQIARQQIKKHRLPQEPMFFVGVIRKTHVSASQPSKLAQHQQSIRTTSLWGLL